MGLLIDGIWSSAWYNTKENGGDFVRDTARFRNWITADGSAGPTGEAGFVRTADAIISISHLPAPGRIVL